MFALLLSAVLLIVLALWWVIGLFAGWSLTLLIVGSIIVIVIAALAWLARRLIAIRRSQQIERQLLAQAERQYQAAAGPEDQSAIDSLRTSFQQNLQALKRSAGTGAASLHDLPWYLLIGLPGSGKTTAIRESGLSFPSGAQSAAVRGIGGTRDCDWWFTDQAIFLDTAGRYTNEQADHDEWLAFLDLLGQQRRQTALNGVVVTVSITDLIQRERSDIEEHARLIRERLDEVAMRLNLVLPFYVVFTKCDMISGFKSIFKNLPDQERERFLGQLVGWEEPPPASGEAFFREGCARFMPWLQRRRLLVLGEGPDADDAKKTIRFPGQVQTVGVWMGQFLEAVARSMPQAETARLRGFFLTSATQPKTGGDNAASLADDQPANAWGGQAAQGGIDMEASIFLAPQAAGSAASPAGPSIDSFFLKNIFRRVLIPDQGLVQLSARALRQQVLLRFASLWGAGAVGLLLMLWIVIAFIGDLGLIGRVETELARMLEVERTAASSEESNLKAIDAVRARITALEESASSPRLRALATGVYHARLRRLVLDRLGEDLSAELKALYQTKDKDRLTADHMYELASVYQMLAGRMTPDAELIGRKLRQDERWLAPFRRVYPDLDSDEIATARSQLDFLLAHLDVSSDWQIDADASLIEAVVRDLAERLWVRQAYEDLIHTGGGQELTQAPVSGRFQHLIQTTSRVPTVFTSEKWQGFVKAAIAEKSKVLVERYRSIGQDRAVDDIAESLRAFYLADYQRYWQNFMRGAQPRAFRDLRDATGKLFDLTGQQSPYRELVEHFWKSQDFQLTERIIGSQGDFPWLDEALNTLGAFQQALSEFERQTAIGSRHQDTERIRVLAAAFDRAERALALQQRSADRDDRRDAVFASLKQILLVSHACFQREIAAEVDERWREQVAIPFREQLAGRYPFDESVEKEGLLSTFSEIFNPANGRFWAIAERIAPLLEINFIGLPILTVSRSYERALVRAEALAAGLFPETANRIAAPITLQLQLREAVWDIHLHISGTSYRLKQLPRARMNATWRQEDPLGAKIDIFIKDDRQLKRDEFADSQWGVLRLFRAADLQARDDGTMRATWDFDGKQIGLIGTYQASAVLETPAFNRLLDPDFFVGFSCPETITTTRDTTP